MSKLIFSTCSYDPGPINPNGVPLFCSVPGVSQGDKVIVTNNGETVCCGGATILNVALAYIEDPDIVTIYFRNTGANTNDPVSYEFSIIAYHP